MRAGIAKAKPGSSVWRATRWATMRTKPRSTWTLTLGIGRFMAGDLRQRDVLARLQRFDPVGIFARDLAECLAIQLKEQQRFDPAIERALGNAEDAGDVGDAHLRAEMKADEHSVLKGKGGDRLPHDARGALGAPPRLPFVRA